MSKIVKMYPHKTPTFDEYKRAIIEKMGLTEAEVLRLVKEKEEELKGLVHSDGAILMVARSFGIKDHQI